MKLKDEGIHFTFLCVAGFVAGVYGVKKRNFLGYLGLMIDWNFD